MNNKDDLNISQSTQATNPWGSLIKSSLLIGGILAVIWAVIVVVSGGWDPRTASGISGLLGNGFGIFIFVSGITFVIKALLHLFRK